MNEEIYIVWRKQFGVHDSDLCDIEVIFNSFEDAEKYLRTKGCGLRMNGWWIPEGDEQEDDHYYTHYEIRKFDIGEPFSSQYMIMPMI